MKFVVYDVETTGLPLWDVPSDDPAQPHITHLAATVLDADLNEVQSINRYVLPQGWEVPPDITELTGITTAFLHENGVPVADVVKEFRDLVHPAELIVAHNSGFDKRMLRIEMKRLGLLEEADAWKEDNRHYCTMKTCTDIVKAPKGNGKKGYKYPTLTETYHYFFGAAPSAAAHRADADVATTVAIFKKLREMRV